VVVLPERLQHVGGDVVLLEFDVDGHFRRDDLEHLGQRRNALLGVQHAEFLEFREAHLGDGTAPIGFVVDGPVVEDYDLAGATPPDVELELCRHLDCFLGGQSRVLRIVFRKAAMRLQRSFVVFLVHVSTKFSTPGQEDAGARCTGTQEISSCRHACSTGVGLRLVLPFTIGRTVSDHFMLGADFDCVLSEW